MVLRTHGLRKTLREHLKSSALILIALAAVLGSSAAATDWAGALSILTGVEDSAIVLDGSQDIPDLSDRMMYVASGSKGYDIRLNAKLDVTIRHDGETLTTVSKKENISALLTRMGITLSPLEMVAVDLSDQELVLTVAEDITYYDEVREMETFNTVRVANPELPKGTERVVQEGADGVRTSIYEVVWSNGERISRQFVEELDSTAVDQIVEYGTSAAAVEQTDRIASVKKNADGSGTLTFESGTTLNFSQAKSMTATAYTAGHGGADYTTATGTFVEVGTVAVDKNVIPLGTRMYIVTNDGIVYGMSVARDTGVKGNKVDLYYNTYRECIEFGRRSCTVYILE